MHSDPNFDQIADGEPEARLRASWETNAAAWAAAVRGGAIPSRRAGTDAAILAACGDVRGLATLDVGCGEGWLARELARRGAAVTGVDASEPLVAAARAAGSETYVVAGYDALATRPALLAGPWALMVCNFALLGDPVAPILAALRARVAPRGRLVIQTMHPWTAAGDGPYRGGWRLETFAGFGDGFTAAMPWYFRPLHAWSAELTHAGWQLAALDEPLHPETERPLSLVLTAVPDERDA